ncbi:hypothetical protein GCM10023193_71100 [Planotetraspora kaengkrachanensis]
MDQAKKNVLSTDVVVVEHPGFFLSQDDNPPRTVGEPLEHLVAPHRAVRRTREIRPVVPHGSPDPATAPIAEGFPESEAFTLYPTP